MNRAPHPLHLLIKRKLQRRYQSALTPTAAAISSADPWAGLHFQLADFQQIEPEDFLDAAYRAILKRYPDHAGFSNYLAVLQRGRSRNEVLYALRHSQEGQLIAVEIDKLTVPGRIRFQQSLRNHIPGLAKCLGSLRNRAQRNRNAE